MNAQTWTLLADLVLLFHFTFVVFVVLGLVLIWVGYLRRWKFVRYFYLRLAHLATMAFVAAESLTGIVCPLTTWENQLRLLAGRGQIYPGSFIHHWLHRILFYEISEGVFTVVYAIFFIAIAQASGS